MTTVAYLTKHDLLVPAQLNVYTNGRREHAANAPRGTSGLAELAAWADTNLKDAGFTRVAGWDQPAGWDKVLHDYKTTVVRTPAEHTAPAVPQAQRSLATATQPRRAIHR